ncbi:MobP2 family relaxase [Pseudolactococcus yaeyamensis]
MVGIVYKMKFKEPFNKKYQNYIKYMDRDEATRTQMYESSNFAFEEADAKADFENYNMYMNRPRANASGLFTSFSDELSSDEVKELKGKFKQAQKNGSLMWQDVISFDNDFLEKYGLYNSQLDQLDEKKIKQAVRMAVSDMLEREGMSNSAIWSGAIHYNTDNFHVHVAIVEPEPTREKIIRTSKKGFTYETYRGTRTKKAGTQNSYARFKSVLLSNLIDNSETTKRLSELMRDVMSRKNIPFIDSPYDYETIANFEKIFQSLPDDKRLWKYGNNAMAGYRDVIDFFVVDYITRNFQEEYREFIDLLDEQVEYYEDTYGKSRAEDYKQNKMDELKRKLGNEFLKECNGYDKALKDKLGLKGFGKVDLEKLPKKQRWRRNFVDYRFQNALNKAFKKTWEESKREFSAERFKRELEQEKENER